MPLDGVQRALGAMVAEHRNAANFETPEGFDLTFEERSWLRQVGGSPGFRVTCYIQRSWRELGVYQSAALTTSALGADHARETVDAYLDSVDCQSFFALAEAIAFLDFVIELKPVLPHVVATARFERAVLATAQEAGLESDRAWCEVNLSPGDRIKQNPAASIVELGARPELLLGALTLGKGLPPEGERLFPIIVAPRLQHLWRPATRDESRLFARCQRATAVDQLLAEACCSEGVLRELVRIGALSVER